MSSRTINCNFTRLLKFRNNFFSFIINFMNNFHKIDNMKCDNNFMKTFHKIIYNILEHFTYFFLNYIGCSRYRRIFDMNFRIRYSFFVSQYDISLTS